MTWEDLDKADPLELLLISPELGKTFPPVRIGICFFKGTDSTTQNEPLSTLFLG